MKKVLESKTKSPNVVYTIRSQEVDWFFFSSSFDSLPFGTLALHVCMYVYLRLNNKRFIYLNAKQGIRVQIECIDFSICSDELDQSNKSNNFFQLLPLLFLLAVLPFKVIVCVRVFYVTVIEWISGCSPNDFTIYVLQWPAANLWTLSIEKKKHHTQHEFHRFSSSSTSSNASDFRFFLLSISSFASFPFFSFSSIDRSHAVCFHSPILLIRRFRLLLSTHTIKGE